MSETQTSNYEMMVILYPDLGEKETEKALDNVRELITSNGGKITAEDIWGIREFAYTIKKYDQGFYAVLNFEMPKSAVKELDKPLNIDQTVIRYLVTSLPDSYKLTTLAEYEEQWAAAEEEEKQEKAKKAKSKPQPKAAAPKKAAAKKEEKPKKAAEKEEDSKSKLEDVDEKLKNIINDPDISL